MLSCVVVISSLLLHGTRLVDNWSAIVNLVVSSKQYGSLSLIITDYIILYTGHSRQVCLPLFCCAHTQVTLFPELCYAIIFLQCLYLLINEFTLSIILFGNIRVNVAILIIRIVKLFILTIDCRNSTNIFFVNESVSVELYLFFERLLVT